MSEVVGEMSDLEIDAMIDDMEGGGSTALMSKWQAALLLIGGVAVFCFFLGIIRYFMVASYGP